MTLSGMAQSRCAQGGVRDERMRSEADRQRYARPWCGRLGGAFEFFGEEKFGVFGELFFAVGGGVAGFEVAA